MYREHGRLELRTGGRRVRCDANTDFEFVRTRFGFAFRIFVFVLICLACTVLCSALLFDALFGVHFFLGEPGTSNLISTIFDQELTPSTIE